MFSQSAVDLSTCSKCSQSFMKHRLNGVALSVEYSWVDRRSLHSNQYTKTSTPPQPPSFPPPHAHQKQRKNCKKHGGRVNAGLKKMIVVSTDSSFYCAGLSLDLSSYWHWFSICTQFSPIFVLTGQLRKSTSNLKWKM